jgi:hypothetical protein
MEHYLRQLNFKQLLKSYDRFSALVGVFGGIHGVSSAVILFVPKLRLVWILRCISVYVNEQYEEQVK